jgi:hypothetical protein
MQIKKSIKKKEIKEIRRITLKEIQFKGGSQFEQSGTCCQHGREKRFNKKRYRESSECFC